MLTRPKVLLHVEGAAVLAGAAWLYSQAALGWVSFAALFLVPDIAMLGYLVNPRVGAACYNLAHTYILPFLLFAVGASLNTLIPASGSWTIYTPSLVWPLQGYALIWLAHIGFDRMLGYGLKYPTQFKDTHLGRV